MKVLTVIRHAEAAQAASDYIRPLTDYGCSQAKSVASQLSEMIQPQLFVVSSATRTRETFSFFKEKFALSDDMVRFEDKVYEASTQALVKVISSFPAEADSVVLIGHNPAVSSLVSSITDRYEGFPTSCAVVMEVDCTAWAEVIYSDVKVISKVLSQK